MPENDPYLMAFMASMDSLGTSINNATNIVATQNLNYDNRQFQSWEAHLSREFNKEMAAETYRRQLEMYDTRMSPSARLRDEMKGYQENGLNPALMFQSGPSSSGGSMPSVSPAQGASPSGGSASGFNPLQAFSFLDAILRIKQTQASVEKIEAETRNIDKSTSWIDSLNSANVEQMRSQIDGIKSNINLNEQKVNESIQSVSESLKRVDYMDSQIEVNGSVIDLNGSQQVLNETRAVVEKLNAQQIEALLPYVQARQEAEIALANAKTDEARASAEDKMYDANLKMLRGLTEAKLIDSSYYDSVIEQANWSAKAKKREYKWKPINDICHNVSMLCIGAGSVMSGGSRVANL